MAKTSALELLSAASADATADYVPAVDASAGDNKRLTLEAVVVAGIAKGAALATMLRGWAASLAFTYTSATRDADGVITTATVRWPDGSAGTFTTTAKNATFMVIDAFTVTHTDSGKTVTQPAVTRDASGNITAQPALTVTP